MLLISQLNARWPERYRANTEGRDQSAKEALNEIREMHTEWKKKLEEGTVVGELTQASEEGVSGCIEGRGIEGLVES